MTVGTPDRASGMAGRLAGRLTPRKRGTRGLGERLQALDAVIELARDRLDPDLVARAELVAGKAGQRLRFGEEHTVVALAGTTGSGKSSLFNAIIGEAVSQVGLRRPTTAAAQAALWPTPAGPQEAGPLLDWLDVPRRHVVGGEQAEGAASDLQGLVLLDLPDVDSVRSQHRLAAERLIDRVDLLVWVLDPQKYADAAVHDRYLVPLAGHADVMLVVLNQIDRLSPPARAGCLDDLRALLRSEGLGDSTVLATAARTGEGIDALQGELVRRVAAKRAAAARLAADLSDVAMSLASSCEGAASSGDVAARDREALVAALADAAGADVVAAAVARSHRMRAQQATGWPFTRWAGRLRRDPARRLRLRETPSDLVRTSLPGPSAVQRARVDAALRELTDRVSDPMPEPWPAAVRRAATASRPAIPDLLDRAVAGADLGLARRPRWWRLVNALQVLLALSAVAGLLWLAVLFGVAWLQLPPPPLPGWDVGAVEIPVPTLLLVGGVALGLLLALLSRSLAAVGSRRSSRRARAQVQQRVEQVADDAVVRPVEQELAAHTAYCDALARVHA